METSEENVVFQQPISLETSEEDVAFQQPISLEEKVFNLKLTIALTIAQLSYSPVNLWAENPVALCQITDLVWDTKFVLCKVRSFMVICYNRNRNKYTWTLIICIASLLFIFQIFIWYYFHWLINLH